MIPSPCRYICQMDPVSKLCQGCFRTIDEIASWSQLGDAARTEILANIAQRRLECDPPKIEPSSHAQQNG